MPFHPVNNHDPIIMNKKIDQCKRQELGEANFSLLRIFVAFLVAPTVPIFIVAGLIKVFDKSSAGSLGLSEGILFLGLSYGFSLILGLPTFFIFESKNIYTLKAYLMAGAAIGFFVALTLLALLFFTTQFPMLVLKNNFGIVYVGIIYGITVSLLFWVIAVNNNQSTTTK
jgi:hypothetical protein